MFINETFPQSLMLYFAKEIEYVSNVNVASSGIEHRKLLKPTSNVFYKLYTTIKKSEDIQLLEQFFHAMQGRKFSFKLYDETDCTLQNSPAIALNAKTVQMQKIINLGGNFIHENITKPKINTVKIFQNGQQIQEGFTINHENGQITFENEIPAGQITISANFFKHVRFNVDTISIKLKGGNSFELDGVTMKTVIN